MNRDWRTSARGDTENLVVTNSDWITFPHQYKGIFIQVPTHHKKKLKKITTTRVSSNHDLRALLTYLILKMLISITQAGVGFFSKFLFVVAWDLSENASWRWDGDLINI